MQIDSRILGYATMGLGIIGLLTGIMAMEKLINNDSYLIQVDFKDAGALYLEDPVVVDGLQVGEIRDIQLIDSSARVTLGLYQKLEIPANSRFVSANYSLMGERRIEIRYGNSPLGLDYHRIQPGVFEPGVSEVLHRVNEVLLLVQNFNRLIIELNRSPDSAMPYLAIVQNQIIPTISNVADLVASVESEITGITTGIAAVSSMAKNTTGLTQSGSGSIRQLLESTDRHIEMGIFLSEKTLLQLDKIHSILTELQSPDSHLYPLVESQQIYQSLVEVTQQVKRILKGLTREGADDLIGFKPNMYFYGPNPSKKIQREREKALEKQKSGD